MGGRRLGRARRWERGRPRRRAVHLGAGRALGGRGRGHHQANPFLSGRDESVRLRRGDRCRVVPRRASAGPGLGLDRPAGARGTFRRPRCRLACARRIDRGRGCDGHPRADRGRLARGARQRFGALDDRVVLLRELVDPAGRRRCRRRHRVAPRARGPRRPFRRHPPASRRAGADRRESRPRAPGRYLDGVRAVPHGWPLRGHRHHRRRGRGGRRPSCCRARAGRRRDRRHGDPRPGLGGAANGRGGVSRSRARPGQPGGRAGDGDRHLARRRRRQRSRSRSRRGRPPPSQSGSSAATRPPAS